jgi:hypothetical protein|tara:strand:+ start:659 stop:1441 length:783 start_codon:yes stop_codon:yes gene_type:complete
MIYLKTYFYVPHEIKFLKMNLREAYNHIDKFIICEYNRTHTGAPKDYIFDQFYNEFTEKEKEKILYVKGDLSKWTVEAYNNEPAIHAINEPAMRGFFETEVDLKDDDIVVSIDADEIIYGHMYPKIIDEVNRRLLVRLNLHQFFYKPTYLWEGKDFVSPIATKYSVFKGSFPGCNWRDQGPIMDGKAGCHFSWCMSPKEMVYKLHTYSHPRYRFCADEDLLTDAIENKKYPFDSSVDFNIKELSVDDKIIPKSATELLDV